MSELSPEGWRNVAAMNARTYAMTPEDRDQWFREHPVSMFAQEGVPLMVRRARERAAEAARDAAECIGLGRTDDARSLLREALGHLDTAAEREQRGDGR